MSINHREQLLRDGFTVVPNVLPKGLLERLRATTDKILDAQTEEDRSRNRSTGSLIGITVDPIFAEVIALPEALAAMEGMGFASPKFSSGYVISKPAHSPRLFWHYDWAGWDDPGAFEPFPQQLFLMYYLVDTSRKNGCLRVIPGSHLHDNPLHGLVGDAHTDKLSQASDLTLTEFSDRPDEVDVAIKAGDLLIGDSRLFHSAHANQSDGRRTVITLWFHPDMNSLAEGTQAFISSMAWAVPETWPAEAKAKLEKLRAVYAGTAKPLPWNRKRPDRVKA